MTPISFKANFIRNTNIQQIENNTTTPKKVAIVELDINQKNDIETLKSVAQNWDNKASGYAGCIYDEAVKKFKFPDTKEHYYAITLQDKNFDKLKPKDILGLTMLSKHTHSNHEINWLQVKPECNYRDARLNRTYKKIGRALVNFIKSISRKTIYVFSADSAKPFYEKLGFKHETFQSKHMYFTK